MAWEANLDARTAYMLQNQTVNLPPHQQQHLHADFLANEQAYLQMRNNLLPQYRGQWVAVHGGQVVVSGVNQVKKHQRPNPMKGQQGGIVTKEMPIHVSNIAIWNPITQKADRIGLRTLEDGRKVRFFRSNGELINA